MIACPDFPIFKHRKQSLMDVVINDGQHIHGVYLSPPWTRLQATVDQHVSSHQDLYLGRAGRVCRIDVVRIEIRPAYVTEYALKALKSGRVSGDDLLILPRTSGELRERLAA